MKYPPNVNLPAEKRAYDHAIETKCLCAHFPRRDKITRWYPCDYHKGLRDQDDERGERAIELLRKADALYEAGCELDDVFAEIRDLLDAEEER